MQDAALDTLCARIKKKILAQVMIRLDLGRDFIISLEHKKVCMVCTAPHKLAFLGLTYGGQYSVSKGPLL